MINIEEVCKSLSKLIGEEFNEDEIICCFEDTEENIIVSKVEGKKTNVEGYGICQLYEVYVDSKSSVSFFIFFIYVDDNNIIRFMY